MTKKAKYLQKEVQFNGESIHMFSLDGVTWSTRKDELLQIQERHELEKASYGGQIKGGPQAKIPTPRPKASSVQTRRSRPVIGSAGSEEEVTNPGSGTDHFKSDASAGRTDGHEMEEEPKNRKKKAAEPQGSKDSSKKGKPSKSKKSVTKSKPKSKKPAAQSKAKRKAQSKKGKKKAAA